MSVTLFKRVRTFFAQKVKSKSFLSKMKKRLLELTIQVFHMQLLRQTQNPPKIRRLDCGSLADLSERLKIISECLFCWIVQNYSNPFQSVKCLRGSFFYPGKCSLGS